MIKKYIKLTIFCLLTSSMVLLPVACSSGASGAGGLVVIGTSTSIGQVSSVNPNTQTYSYQVTFQNKSDVTIYIESIEPVLSSKVESKVLVDNLIKAVSRNVAGGGTLEVTGSFPFDATGLSKEDIAKLEPFITAYRVTSDETLPIPGQKS